LGRSLKNPGKNPKRRKGRARPIPVRLIIKNITKGGWEKAKPMALPKTGAVQGVATNTAKIPVKKDPLYPFFRDRESALFIAEEGGKRANTPNKDRAKR